MSAEKQRLEQEQEELHYLKLYGRVSKTAANRFNAERRLRRHDQASLWTISIFSLILILGSLLQALEFDLPISAKAVNLGQSFLAITILVISVILSKSNYLSRAERFHNCGLELMELALRLERIEKADGTIQKYNAFAAEYAEILKRYENHANIDFMFMKLQKPQHYTLPFWYPPFVHVRYFLQFLPYITLLSLGLAWVGFLTYFAFTKEAL